MSHIVLAGVYNRTCMACYSAQPQEEVPSGRGCPALLQIIFSWHDACAHELCDEGAPPTGQCNTPSV
jgi:hypothetical protein